MIFLMDNSFDNYTQFAREVAVASLVIVINKEVKL